MPVTVALGDNQASFIGSAPEPGRSLLLNVGTGGQISARTDGFHFIPGLENRPFPEGQYLLIGGGLFGGRSYAYLQRFFREVGTKLLDSELVDDLYARMTELAAAVPEGSDGLRCEPFFTGSRTDPGLRASFSGLSPDNFTPGHFARALLEGMADGFFAFFEQMKPVVGVPPLLVGAGNGGAAERAAGPDPGAPFREDAADSEPCGGGGGRRGSCGVSRLGNLRESGDSSGCAAGLRGRSRTVARETGAARPRSKERSLKSYSRTCISPKTIHL